jgi:hypothetical protein
MAVRNPDDFGGRQMKAAEVIRAAKDSLFRDGWCQWVYEEADGRICARKAIWHAAGSEFSERLEAERYVARAAGDEGYRERLDDGQIYIRGEGVHPVEFYNDKPGRTFSEIVDLFDKAEKFAEADGR